MQQSITWAIVDPDQCRHMTSLIYNELNRCVQCWPLRDSVIRRAFPYQDVSMIYTKYSHQYVTPRWVDSWVQRGPAHDSPMWTHIDPMNVDIVGTGTMDHSVYVAPSQWEMALQCLSSAGRMHRMIPELLSSYCSNGLRRPGARILSTNLVMHS